MVIPHVVAIPYPAQGHVTPLMLLVRKIVRHGIKVTFVNTEFNQSRVLKALQQNVDDEEAQKKINLVSIPDGLEPWEDRNDLGKLSPAIHNVMPGKLEELIEKINECNEDKVSVILADGGGMGWALRVAEKMGIKRAAFWPAAAATLASVLSIPNMIQDGIIDVEGSVMKKQMLYLSPGMPAIDTEALVWNCFFDPATKKAQFEVCFDGAKSMKSVDWIICNSSYELEKAAFDLHPKALPVGPLSAAKTIENQTGSFWSVDSTCLQWLDQQQENSVIYVAFGSFTLLDVKQFQQLALGLELTNRPFLWVVRPDMTDTTTNEAYPKGFEERVGNRGLMVSWAPQQRVLRHPSVACFVSHCGWNSTTEGVSNGLPFLCWPYFADQLLDKTYICDIWRIGLGFEKDENGIIQSEEIKEKVEKLLADGGFKARAMDLKDKVVKSVDGDGSSCNNFNYFIDWMKT